MNILLVCQYFYPEQFKINDICFEMVAKGHKVTILTGLPNYPSGIIKNEYKWFKKRIEFINGVKVIRVPLIGRGKSKAKLILNYISFAITASLKTIFMKKDFDLIVVYQLSPILMALPAILMKRLSGKKLLLYCHDLWPESISSAGIKSHSFVYKTLLAISKWIYNACDEIAISSSYFNYYFRDVLDYDKKLLYLPVYAEDLFSIVEPAEISERTHLLFAGNIGEMQSVETIINAAIRLKDNRNIIWHIVGDGSAKIKCENIAKDNKLDNVIFYGQKPIAEMTGLYNMADAFLITLKKNEIISYTLPNKVQSYMSAGKVILGSIYGETKSVLEEANCGFCCEPENDEALANLVSDFISNKESYRILGLNGRQYYKNNFSKNIFYSKFILLLQQLLQKEEKHV